MGLGVDTYVSEGSYNHAMRMYLLLETNFQSLIIYYSLTLGLKSYASRLPFPGIYSIIALRYYDKTSF